MSLRMHKIIVTMAAVLALPVVALIPVSSQAAIIQSWNYTVTSYFDTGFTQTCTDQDGACSFGGVTRSDWDEHPGVGSDNQLSWSDNDGDTSWIAVDGLVTNPPALVTNDPTGVAGASFYHHNQTLDEDAYTLATAAILSTLTLDPVGPSGSSVGPLPKTFSISFLETPNDGSCPAGSTTDCDDIFVLRNPESLVTTFEQGQVAYTLRLDITGLTNLSEEACRDAGVAAGCVGLLTGEGGTTNFGTTFTIMASVPAPGTLSILALGLLCLAWAGYSRKRRIA